MVCRSLCWLVCISVAAAASAGDSDAHIIKGSNPEVSVSLVRTGNVESSTTDPGQERKQTAAVELSSLLDAGEAAVVTLVAGGSRLMAHRAVLAARSPVFAAIFGNNSLESSSGVVTVTDVEGPVLRQLVAYMYTLQAPQLPSMALQLLDAADRYGVSALKAACERQVAAQLSVENATAMAVLAVRNSYSGLRQAAVAFIKSRIFHVMATQGWTDAMRSQPKDLIEVIQLLSGPPAVTNDDGKTPATAAPAVGVCSNLSTDDPAVSLLRGLSKEEKGRRLIEAAKHGGVEQLRVLVAAGADVEAREDGGETALQWATLSGQVEAMRCLLGLGADVNTQNGYRNAPLHRAVMRGDADGVRLLVAASADLSARNLEGCTPLHTAAHDGRAEAATALLAAGADRQARDYEGNTPLELARQNHRQQLIEMLQ